MRNSKTTTIVLTPKMNAEIDFILRAMLMGGVIPLDAGSKIAAIRYALEETAKDLRQKTAHWPDRAFEGVGRGEFTESESDDMPTPGGI